MNKLEAMTHQELRRYVLANRHDRAAIELLAKQTMASPRLKSFGANETDRLEEILRGGLWQLNHAENDRVSQFWYLILG